MALPKSELCPLHVMVVDPRGEDARLFRYLSQAFGRQVALAADPTDALEQVRCPSIEVVVVRTDSIDDHCGALIRSLREVRPNLGIILIAAAPDSEAMVSAMEADVDEFFLGRTEPEQVREIVDELVQARKHT